MLVNNISQKSENNYKFPKEIQKQMHYSNLLNASCFLIVL